MAEKKKTTTKPKTVKMVRDGERADVHPDEVKNMSNYGWSKA